MTGWPSEDDHDVWLEIGSLLKDIAKVAAWFLLIALISGSAVALIVLRWIA